MLGLVLAVCVSAGSVAAALRELARTGRASPADAAGILRDLRSDEPAVVEAAVRRAFPEADPALARAVLQRSSREEGVAILNEQLGDLSRELTAGRDVARGALRVALFAGTLGGVLEFARGLSVGGGSARVEASGAVIMGVAGAAACVEIGRRTLARADRSRAAWDRIAAAVGRHLAADGPDPVAAGQLRRARRRAGG